MVRPFRFLIVAALVAFTTIAHAADTSPTPAKKADPVIVEARKLIAEKKYAEALPILKAYVAREDKSADGWNLYGFATRKTGDTATAETYYMKALAIDPEHRGALAYLGTMYVELKRMDDARVILKRLDKACLFGCDEYDEVKKAIETGRAY